jgi:hypothetical protein
VHVAIAFVLAILAIALLVLLAGLTPFLGVPIAVVLFVIPFVWVALAGGAAGRGRRVDKSGVPSTAQATYDPAVDPAERG